MDVDGGLMSSSYRLESRVVCDGCCLECELYAVASVQKYWEKRDVLAAGIQTRRGFKPRREGLWRLVPCWVRWFCLLKFGWTLELAMIQHLGWNRGVESWQFVFLGQEAGMDWCNLAAWRTLGRPTLNPLRRSGQATGVRGAKRMTACRHRPL